MSDYFEIDFLEVHTSKSGDAIGLRYRIGGHTFIHVIDGGYASTGNDLVQHINEYYDEPTYIDHVVVTHPDKDHAEGLQAVLENFSVGALWMLLPWDYVDYLVGRFDRYTNTENLKKKLREAYPYLVELETIAKRKGIPIYEPFQGQRIGAFAVLAPSKSRYLDLVVTSAKTPQAEAQDGLLARVEKALAEAVKATRALLRAAWGVEFFPEGGTSNENEMSVVQFGQLCGKSIVLTADTGREGLAEAADYAPAAGLVLPCNVELFQVPHHGGRHNVSTEILDRWLGKPLTNRPSLEAATFTAVVSAARDDEDHPRKAVVRAFYHRGATVVSTADGSGTKSWSYNMPKRDGWTSSIPVAYPEEMEE